MLLIDSSRDQLRDYLLRQLEHFFPDRDGQLAAVIDSHLDEALARVAGCVNAVKMWPSNQFDYLHSSQYAIFLYFLSHTIWNRIGNRKVATKLFLLNKALNAIDCFYEIELPPVFFIGHTVGIVLAKAVYGNYLVLYQNSTVGKNHGAAPTLGNGVIMYPHSAIIGACAIADGTVVAQGVSIINRDTPANHMVFDGSGGDLVFKASSRDILSDFFRPAVLS